MEASDRTVPTPELFGNLVTALLESMQPDGGGNDDTARPPTLVKIEPDPDNPDGFRLGLLDAPGDPYSTLAGFRAPSDWMAMGMVTAGWTYPPDIAEAVDFERARFLPVPPSQHPRRLRVRTAYLCTQSGRAYGRTVVSDGRTVDEPPSSGRMVDAFRRAFALPTDPPPTDVAELFTLRWLTNIAAVARLDGRTLGWDEAAALHDAVAMLDLEPDDLEAAARALHKTGTWELLREGTAAEKGLSPIIKASHAAWMDEGMFAREVLAHYPSVPILLDELTDAVGAGTARRVRTLIRSWGIDTAPWAA
ncbi:MAG: hypothetical protein QOG03_1291 [Actinomycetota bacterium]|jgi:hypothetical protein|nr:hypothetical protein [Actinomycetota bacterium]